MKASVTSIERKSPGGRSRALSERVVLQFGKHVIRGFADRHAFDACLAFAGANGTAAVDAVMVHVVGSPGPKRSRSRV